MVGRFDLKVLPIDFVECLTRFLPTEAEGKLLRQYERERRPLEDLADEDRFMLHFSKIERLTQRMSIITFIGNFNDNVQLLTPVLRRQHALLLIYMCSRLQLQSSFIHSRF